MPDLNHRILLKSRPQGWATEDNFELVTSDIPAIEEGELLVRNIYLSVDPYMRGRMDDVKSYVPPFQIGKVIEGGAIGEVIKSNHSDFKVGDYISGHLGWETYSKSQGQGLTIIDPDIAPLSYHLGILGMPGMTAYTGLVEIGEAKKGDTVFVSAASGAVGSIVGQIAKILECTVVGCAGSDNKVQLLVDELGFDRAFNYKTCESIAKTVRENCPEGIDVNFENVGGEILEAALWNMSDFGRIALCGLISNYNDTKMAPGPRGLGTLIRRRVKMQGFIVSDNPKWCKEYLQKASKWLESGQLKYHESVADGLENAPSAFIGMLKGQNFGKQVVKIFDE